MEIQITQDLVRMESVTPNDGGCLDYISSKLAAQGFVNETLTYGRVKNLWSVIDNGGPLLVFAGHVDVVPSGPIDKWEHDPFSGHNDGGGGHELQRPTRTCESDPNAAMLRKVAAGERVCRYIGFGWPLCTQHF